MVKTARNLVGHQIGWWLWWQLWWRIWWFTNFVDKFDDLFWSQNLSPNLSLNSSQYSSPNISPNFANQQIFHQIFHQNHHPISWPTKCGDENDIKIITQFGESPNKVTNMSPNSSPNLVITKFVTKFITKFVTKHLGDLTKITIFTWLRFVCFFESRMWSWRPSMRWPSLRWWRRFGQGSTSWVVGLDCQAGGLISSAMMNYWCFPWVSIWSNNNLSEYIFFRPAELRGPSFGWEPLQPLHQFRNQI